MVFKPENKETVFAYFRMVSGFMILCALLYMMLTNRLTTREFVAILGSLTALSHFGQGIEGATKAARLRADDLWSHRKGLSPGVEIRHIPPPIQSGATDDDPTGRTG